MLIILGGLPGVGKTTIARVLAEITGAVHLRIDTIESAIKESSIDCAKECLDAGAGYMVAYGIAKDNLRIGNIVIADSVNSVTITRESWRNVAILTDKEFIEVEIICSDSAEHRNRVENRKADIKHHILPTWQEVQDREYDEWQGNKIVIDTAKHDVSQCVSEIMENNLLRQKQK